MESLRSKIIFYVEKNLGKLDPEPAAASVCPAVTINGDGDHWALLDRGPLLAFAGGNLFKWAPLLGAELATLALGGESDPRLREACREL